ncbi:MAG: hypothetical protein H0T92_20155, partial [Pyrinomonadaceae bacterium]|nr:hypothetical protein [Pyrinomonadaceae bacterium]
MSSNQMQQAQIRKTQMDPILDAERLRQDAAYKKTMTDNATNEIERKKTEDDRRDNRFGLSFPERQRFNTWRMKNGDSTLSLREQIAKWERDEFDKEFSEKVRHNKAGEAQ